MEYLFLNSVEIAHFQFMNLSDERLWTQHQSSRRPKITYHKTDLLHQQSLNDYLSHTGRRDAFLLAVPRLNLHLGNSITGDRMLYKLNKLSTLCEL